MEIVKPQIMVKAETISAFLWREALSVAGVLRSSA
jgi:hypothetical protein